MMSKKWIQTADWKSEKHVPAIEIEKKEDGLYYIHVSVGKEIAHPNTIEHHIRWINVWFWPEGGKFPIEVGYSTFDIHNEDMLCEPYTMFTLKTDKKGTVMATSYCNIHGIWQSDELEI